MMEGPPLNNTNYISFGTFRKNGQAVNTPVWFAPDSDNGKHFFIFSANNAGKVKRLRNSNQAQIATCTFNGTLTGDWVPATAKLIHDTAEISHAHRCLQKKYGWQLKSLDLASRLAGKIQQREFIKIQLLGT